MFYNNQRPDQNQDPYQSFNQNQGQGFQGFQGMPGMMQSPQPPIQDSEEPDTHKTKDVLFAIGKGCLALIAVVGTIALIIFMLKIVGLVGSETGNLIENTGRHLHRLFGSARFYPFPNAEFAQLIFIAVFVGFVIYRVRCWNYNRNKKDKD